MVPFPIAAVEFHHYLIELFQLEDICGRLLDDCHQRVIIASALLRLQLPFLLRLPRSWLLLLLWLLLASGLLGAQCFHCIALSFSLSSSPRLPPLPLRQNSGSLRPCLRREPVRLPFWLLARFVDGLAPSACVVRRPYGSTTRSSTMSCVSSTHHFLHALNMFPSMFQRHSLALSPLLLLRALLGPRLLFLLYAPPEHSLLSLALLEPSLLVVAHLAALVPPALFSAPLAPPALSSLLHAPPALSFLPLLSSRRRFLLSALKPVVSRSSAPLARSNLPVTSGSSVLSAFVSSCCSS